MSNLEKVIKYGVHQITAYNIKTGMPYGTAKVIGEASLSLSGGLNKLYGGSSPFSHAVNPGTIESEVKIKLKEYPPFATQLFLGATPTHTTAASLTGEVSTAENVSGTLIEASTGIASVGLKAGSTVDLKFGNYVVKAMSATTVHVYLSTDIDNARGTSLTFYDKDQRITDTPLTIASGAPVEIPNTGLELTGGSGVIALNTDDTCVFTAKPPYSEKIVTEVNSNVIFPDFGLLIYGERVGDSQLNEVEVYRCKGIGGNLGFTEKGFSEQELTASAFLDSKNRLFKETTIS